MKFFIGLILMFQCMLLSYGVWQVLQPNQTTVAFGIFNIVCNLISGALNVRNLFNE